eukprot:NODE_2069_length_1307_cov_21.614467_g1882_i0.p1 GENE.NODE_2069_length_1307_cov_21.614467_g1882_i0~~NODE_2069_length_1307_cov_21.614467_g1882_i0.p1  ORF type:complete len:400 (-),score=77.78 NODE_2069_length_1307_cov_21.614467_g1882_i0:107-1231(-)
MRPAERLAVAAASFGCGSLTATVVLLLFMAIRRYQPALLSPPPPPPPAQIPPISRCCCGQTTCTRVAWSRCLPASAQVEPCPARSVVARCECGRVHSAADDAAVQRALESCRRNCYHHRTLPCLRSKIIVCEEVAEYRQAAQRLVSEADVVVEIGCHVGATSLYLLRARPRQVVFLDQRPTLVKEALTTLRAKVLERNAATSRFTASVRELTCQEHLSRCSRSATECKPSGNPVQHLADDEDENLEISAPPSTTTSRDAEAADFHFLGGFVVEWMPVRSEAGRPSETLVHFVAMDALNLRVFRKLSNFPQAGATRCFVDVSGSRDVPFVFRILNAVEHGLAAPGMVVVKNQPLRRVLLRSSLWDAMAAGEEGSL